MPRILCYLHGLEPGGVERMGLRLCEAWAADGLDVTVVMGRMAGTPAGGALRCVPLPDPGFSTRAFETLWMLLWLPGIVRRTQPDILFCAGNSYTIVAVALRLLLGWRCPPIVAKISNDHARPDLPGAVRRFYRLWCRIQGRAIDRFVALSDAMRDEAAPLLGLVPARVAVIADPVLSDAQVADLAAAGEGARASAAFRTGRRFLAIGRLAPQKDFAAMVRAFAQGAAPADRLVIVGEGPERGRLERLIARLGLTGRVMLPGHDPDIAGWIARSDVFLLSSRYEGLPAVVVEVRAAGLPLIATDCCRSLETLFEGRSDTRLVPVGDDYALAAAIAVPPLFAPADAAFARRFAVAPAARAYCREFMELTGRAHIGAPTATAVTASPR